MTLDYDFWISAGETLLGFNKAITLNNAEERATATFRKEQFDSQATVGDQSLTGWWTRGQLSFHKGAGTRYYEVSAGDTIADTFDTCQRVDVFTPGEVVLTNSMSELGINATDATIASLSEGAGIFALTTTGVVYTAGESTTAIATSDGLPPTSICSNGRTYYVTNGTKIERQYVASEARINHVTNPSFEINTDGWTKTGAESSLNRTTSWAKFGTRGCSLGGTVGGVTRSARYTCTGLTIGRTYKVACWAYYQSQGGYPDAYLTMGGVQAAIPSRNDQGWAHPVLTFTATATSHMLEVIVPAATGDITPNIVIDAVLVTESPYTDGYFDGSQPGCSWQGIAHASKSNYTTASAGSSVVRITSTDSSFQQVWWAKGRLWAVDASQRLYALPDVENSGVTSADSFWTSANPTPTWSLTDSPGAVFISDGSDIFAVTIDTDGLVPTLDSPTTAARLPMGEQVVDMAYYLSSLVVTTTRGVRVCVVQDDQIYLGPLTIQGDFSHSAGGGNFDTRVYVAGRVDGFQGAVVMCAIDLAEANEDLTYPWQPVRVLVTDSSTSDGVVVDATGRVFAWAGGVLTSSSRDVLDATGEIATGWHRFGTLDSKFFAQMRLRTSGTGSVEVHAVTPDGTDTLLGTASAEAEATTFPLAVTGERVRLRFVLQRDATDDTKGPTLLGYQIKALPVPVRQRMIRLPLMLAMQETNRRGGTTRSPAFARLAALEALEEANSIVAFTDKETGEEGTAFIESVEVSRTTPTGPGNDAYGGTIFLTLRVL